VLCVCWFAAPSSYRLIDFLMALSSCWRSRKRSSLKRRWTLVVELIKSFDSLKWETYLQLAVGVSDRLECKHQLLKRYLGYSDGVHPHLVWISLVHTVEVRQGKRCLRIRTEVLDVPINSRGNFVDTTFGWDAIHFSWTSSTDFRFEDSVVCRRKVSADKHAGPKSPHKGVLSSTCLPLFFRYLQSLTLFIGGAQSQIEFCLDVSNTGFVYPLSELGRVVCKSPIGLFQLLLMTK
jgi:hypothetical protein